MFVLSSLITGLPWNPWLGDLERGIGLLTEGLVTYSGFTVLKLWYCDQQKLRLT